MYSNQRLMSQSVSLSLAGCGRSDRSQWRATGTRRALVVCGPVHSPGVPGADPQCGRGLEGERGSRSGTQ